MKILPFATSEELAPLDTALGSECPDIWYEIAACLYLQLCTDPMLSAAGKDDIASLVLSLIDVLQSEIGGSQPYLPRGVSARVRERNKRIRREFNGTNFSELAREFRISERQLRCIVGEKDAG